MLRLSPPGYLRFEQARSFDAVYGGGEANVAISLANYGLDASFVTNPGKPPGPGGRQRDASLRGRHPVHAWGGERLGIYSWRRGVPKAFEIVYTTGNSRRFPRCRARISTGPLFSQMPTGSISPASRLPWGHRRRSGARCLEGGECRRALRLLHLNFRKNLWSSEKAGNVMADLYALRRLCIANEEDAENVFGIKAAAAISREGS